MWSQASRPPQRSQASSTSRSPASRSARSAIRTCDRPPRRGPRRRPLGLVARATGRGRSRRPPPRPAPGRPPGRSRRSSRGRRPAGRAIRGGERLIHAVDGPRAFAVRAAVGAGPFIRVAIRRAPRSQGAEAAAGSAHTASPEVNLTPRASTVRALRRDDPNLPETRATRSPTGPVARRDLPRLRLPLRRHDLDGRTGAGRRGAERPASSAALVPADERGGPCRRPRSRAGRSRPARRSTARPRSWARRGPPVVSGLTRTTTEAVGEALALADRIGARVVLDRAEPDLGRVAAFQTGGGSRRRSARSRTGPTWSSSGGSTRSRPTRALGALLGRAAGPVRARGRAGGR